MWGFLLALLLPNLVLDVKGFYHRSNITSGTPTDTVKNSFIANSAYEDCSEALLSGIQKLLM